MKKVTTLMACTSVFVGIGWGISPATAQTTGLIPLRGKVGVFLPGGSAQDFAGNTHFNGEAELLLPRLFPGSGITGINVGYSQGSRSGNKLRMIPVTVEKLFGLPNPAAAVTGNIYAGAGIGPYFVRVSRERRSTSETTLGGFGVVGYQFPSKLFVEAKYHVAGRVNRVSPSGLALMIGRSF
ncbi:MAG TPA: hypothetical protein VF600_02940 [Abditibacteriaceae bacterium]